MHVSLLRVASFALAIVLSAYPDSRTKSESFSGSVALRPTSAAPVEIFVSMSGKDSGAGTFADPFGTLERARREVRSVLLKGPPIGGVVIWLRGGTYEVSNTVGLGEEDSGFEDSEVVWSGYPGEKVRVIGGRMLDPKWFSPVTSESPVWRRVDESARGKLVQIDLRKHGIMDFGVLRVRGYGTAAHAGLELFVDGAPLPLGRWPKVSRNDPAPVVNGESVRIFGSCSPDVTGTYLKTGEQDGVSAFRRNGLVAGLQYFLHRFTWQSQGKSFTAWFICTDESGYPLAQHPFWSRSAADFGAFRPDPSSKATGTPTTVDPERVIHGFAAIAGPVTDDSFGYAGNRPDRWAGAPDVWFHGYWKYGWADFHLPGARIDTLRRKITLQKAPPTYGIQAGQPFYAYNLLEEITEPGEWYLDRQSGTLYLWPPTNPLSSDIVVSLLEGPIFQLSGTKYIRIQDMTLEATRSELITVAGGYRNVLQGLTLRNAGNSAAVLSGTANRVTNCQVYGAGDGGVSISGGDRKSLIRGDNVVEESTIHDFGRWTRSYAPGIRLDGVGNTLRHSLVYNAPHAAILFSGNDNLIELNEIHDVCVSSADAGAVYAGRDWGARGNIIRHNFIHALETYMEGSPIVGIYLDDCLSGIRVEGNILYGIKGDAILHGGGRDDIMVNNVFARCSTALSTDSRCFEWRRQGGGLNNNPGDSLNLLEKLEKLGYRDEPWKTRYPECAAIPDSWNALVAPGALWLFPQGCVFSRNIGYKNDRWISQTRPTDRETTSYYKEIANNQEEAYPLFVDEAAMHLSLRSDSSAFKIPGFEPIPFESIGPARKAP